ncbi:MAG: 30S ribosomal protein S16 [Patescibacteria group bacterium]
MLIIRLYPTGRKHQIQYRLVLANKKRSVSKEYIENLGTFNPRTKETKINSDRIKYWLEQNVEVSDRVIKILDKQGVKK